MTSPAQRDFPWNDLTQSLSDSATDAARQAGLIHLRNAWTRSRQTIASLENALADWRSDSRIACIYLTGSIARMEQRRQSDCDLVVLTREPCGPDGPDSRGQDELMQQLWNRLQTLQFLPPRADGIYSVTTPASALHDPKSRGQVTEPIDIFGKRMQLLLDGQPVLHAKRFEELRIQILDWYLGNEDPTNRNSTPSWTPGFLLRDLLRYFHALAVRTMWNPDPSERLKLEFKFNHSRVMCYAGMVSILAEWMETRRPDLQQLSLLLKLTPLQRVVKGIERCHPEDIPELLVLSGTFLAGLDDLDEGRPIKDIESQVETDRFRCLLEKLFARGLQSWPDSIRKPLLLP